MIAKILIVPLILIIGALAWFGRGIFFPKATATPTSTISAIPTAIATATPTIVPTATPSKIPAGWQSYTNLQYDFTVSYPPDYKVLTDKENLYGWPKAIALIYGGGQAYDVAIEIWDTEAEYKAKYPGEKLAVYKVFDKFLTVSDQTKNAETEEIISTFSLNQAP
jgi:hypothetical protein